MEPHGRLVLFGTSAGSEATLQLRDVYRNGLRILAYADLRLTGEQRRKGLEVALGALADRAVTGKVILQLR